ncbi:uncharacterized protein LOC125720479 [Brienomyrus brachyistius]|uniref:uncharacterized protein LOC125720479 n=1 Tax=Brienomyrus brachyistius TaxID=42636 RepID=UPI0020B2180C|nr:uncharacterized protein LOC125720479 [Brienomyrus brachyistius]
MNHLLLLALFFSAVAARLPVKEERGGPPQNSGWPQFDNEQKGGSMGTGRPMGGSMDSDRPMGGSVHPVRPMGTGERKPHLPGKEKRPRRSQEYLRLWPWLGDMGREGEDLQEYWEQERNGRQPPMQPSEQRGRPNELPGGPMPGRPNPVNHKKFIPIFKANNVTLQNASLYHFKEGENVFLLPKDHAEGPHPKGWANAPLEMGYGYGYYGLQPYLKVYFNSASPQTVSFEYGIVSPLPAFLKDDLDFYADG